MTLGVTTFSRFVNEIEARAQDHTVEDLAAWAVTTLGETIGFECAWYGWASLDGSDVDIFANGKSNLPDDYFGFWQTVSEEDLLAARIRRSPDEVATYHRDHGEQTEGMVALADRYHIRNMATVMEQRDDRKASFFMSSYRSGPQAADWSEDELEFLRCSVEQVCRTMRQSLVRETHDGTDGALPLYVSDRGVSVVGLANLHDHLEEIARELRDGILPAYLEELLSEPGSYVLKERGLVVRVHSSAGGSVEGLRRLSVRRLKKSDLLTARELQVARALAEGLRYKEVARMLGTAPSTVRNQTQAIYEKLEIHNRASLASIFDRTH